MDHIILLRCWRLQWANFLNSLLTFHSAFLFSLLLISANILIFLSMKQLSTNNLRHLLHVAIELFFIFLHLEWFQLYAIVGRQVRK